MSVKSKLALTRQQYSAFLDDPDSIRAFERLFDIAYLLETLPPILWTPTLIGSTVAGAQTYVSQVGTYCKVGRLVHIQGRVEISAKDGAIAGDLRIGGVPFAPSALANNYGSLAIALYSGLTLGAGRTQIGVRILPTVAASFAVVCSGSAVAPANITVANTAASSSIEFCGTYFTDE